MKIAPGFSGDFGWGARPTVAVTDDELPVPMCIAPATITPPDAPVQFTVTATDNCGVAWVEITGYDRFQIKKNGMVIDKTGSCIISILDDSITIDDVGGMNTHITWTISVVDVHGNQAEGDCEVLVVNPAGN